MKRAVFAAAIALTVAGCAGREEKELTEISDRLTRERTEKVSTAQELLPMQRDLRTLEAELASVREIQDPRQFADDVGKIATVNAADPDSVSIVGAPAAGLTETLDRLAVQFPSAGISEAAKTGKGFSARLAVLRPDPGSSPTPRPARTPVVLPAASRFESTRAVALRNRIKALDGELEALDPIVRKIDEVHARRAEADARIRSLARTDRLVNAAEIVDALGPLLTHAEFTFGRDRAQVKGDLVAGAPIDLVLASLAKKLELTQNQAPAGSISIELSRRETN